MLVVAKVGRKREEKAPRRAFCWVSSFDTSSWFLCGQSGVAVVKTQEAFYLKLQQKLTDHTAGSSCCTTWTCKHLVIHLKWDQNIISTHLCMASDFPFWAEHSCTKCSFHKRWVYISAGTLLWIYRRLIGRSYIALARQDQYIGNILDPLRNLRSWLFWYLLKCCITISAGTLLWIYRRLIGRAYIALARRQDQYIGNISDPLIRLRSWLFW